jgi:hypothetical protein
MAKMVVSGESYSKIELKKAAPLRRCLIVFICSNPMGLKPI